MKDSDWVLHIHIKTKCEHRVRKAFGTDEYGLVEIPRKIGNCQISRIHNFQKMGGCPYCFPHGFECTNSTALKRRNCNWKRYRKRQWK